MTDPRSPDRPTAETPETATPPVVDTAPPIAPAAEQSPWYSAPSGKPFSIPDFAHEVRALLGSLLQPMPQPIPVPVKARRPR